MRVRFSLFFVFLLAGFSVKSQYYYKDILPDPAKPGELEGIPRSKSKGSQHSKY